MHELKGKLQSWVTKKVLHPHKDWWLAGISFAESSFFPIPPDVLLIAILLTKERVRAYYYAFITTASSVLGGVFGYVIGVFLFESVGTFIIETYSLQEEMIKIGQSFSEHAFLAILVSAFTPIPYKLFTIAAGVFAVPIVPFIAASIVGRGARFYLEAFLLKRYGERMAVFLKRWFDLITLGIIILIVGLIIIF